MSEISGKPFEFIFNTTVTYDNLNINDEIIVYNAEYQNEKYNFLAIIQSYKVICTKKKIYKWSEFSLKNYYINTSISLKFDVYVTGYKKNLEFKLN